MREFGRELNSYTKL